LCRAAWTESEVAEFISYMNRTIDANKGSELTVFHNGFYSYKNAGIGIACYATYYENPRAPAILAGLEMRFGSEFSPPGGCAGMVVRGRRATMCTTGSSTG
jgi:hypothetical protein